MTDRLSLRLSFLKNSPFYIFVGYAVLLGAALFFAYRFMTAYCISTLNSETVFVSLFYHDVVELGHPASLWQWGGDSALFPDVVTIFFFNFVLKDGLLALEANAAFFFLCWLAAFVALAIVMKRTNKLAFFAILLLLWVGLATNFGIPGYYEIHIQRPLFLPVYHSGTGLLCLMAFTVLLSQLNRGWNAKCWLLVPFVFLASISDPLFLIVFVFPALATLALLAISFPQGWRTYLILTGIISVTAALAHWLAPYCFPPSTLASDVTQYHPEYAMSSVRVAVQNLISPQSHIFAFLVFLDAVILGVGLVGLIFFFFLKEQLVHLNTTFISSVHSTILLNVSSVTRQIDYRKRVLPQSFTILAFSAFVILFNWGAVILTSNYRELDSDKYVTIPLVLPFCMIAFGLHALIPWRFWLEGLFVVAVATTTIFAAKFPPRPSDDYAYAQILVPYLQKIMEEEHIKAGLSDYWRSNLITFVSHGAVPLQSVTGSGSIFHMINTLTSYGQGLPFKQWPHFRLILLPDPELLRVWGKPDKVIHNPLFMDVWIYSEQRSILYNPYFCTLSNSFLDNGRTIKINASDLPSHTGTIQNTSRIAVAGRDQPEFLTYGPYQRLAPAHYRILLAYAYLAPPAPDKVSTYDCLGSDKNVTLDAQPLPYLDNAEHIFARDLTVTCKDQDFEMRTYYHGSGTLRIDSLSITYLDP